MAIQHLEMTGKTTDEAIARALAQLGLDRDDVSVEVLDQGKKGFLGFGTVPAKVRVTYGLEEPEKVEPTVEKKPERPAAPPPPPPPPAPVKEEAKPERKKAEKPRPERQQSQPKTAPEKQSVEASAPAPAPEDLGEPCDDEKARKITAFLTGLLEHMDSSAQVKVYKPEEGRYKVILEGEKMGPIIGHRGETLDAIQQLTSCSVNRSGEKRVRIHVDAQNYRFKREQSLQNMARRIAGKVVKSRRSITLEPMNAYERHVVHAALQDVEGITTYSTGIDPNRRVTVAYDKGERRHRQR